LGELPYLAGTTLEGLRLFAPVTLVQRQAVVDTSLDGHFVPRNTVVGVCAAAVHRSEAHYIDAAKFDPMRDGLDYKMLRPESCYMTFSGGPRGCPG
jgi:cytochrome P450